MRKQMISVPFFLLRVITAAAALVTGLAQTFVFAHVFTPHRFSIFILVGAIGYSLWLIDFGVVKILFVRLRDRFLAHDRSIDIPGHATAIVLFYTTLVSGGALVCFAVSTAMTSASINEAAEFGLFFLFVSLNLPWFALRYIAIAVDEYVLFEALETLRRAAYFVGLAALYFGGSFALILTALNGIWAGVLVVCVRRMIARGAMLARLAGTLGRLRSFYRGNRSELWRSGTYAASEIYIYNYPYLIMPLLFGLGAPAIILDTAFKVFRGGAMINNAVCDILVPRQTSALRERDGATLVRATLVAAALCAIPTVLASAIFFLAGDKVFALLLGQSATMPAASAPILAAMLGSVMAQIVANSMLVHNGYFRDVARIGTGLVAAMTALAGFALIVHLDIVNFLEAYTAIFAGGALAAVVQMIRGPISLAYTGDAPAAKPSQKRSKIKSAPLPVSGSR